MAIFHMNFLTPSSLKISSVRVWLHRTHYTASIVNEKLTQPPISAIIGWVYVHSIILFIKRRAYLPRF